MAQKANKRPRLDLGGGEDDDEYDTGPGTATTTTTTTTKKRVNPFLRFSGAGKRASAGAGGKKNNNDDKKNEHERGVEEKDKDGEGEEEEPDYLSMSILDEINSRLPRAPETFAERMRRKKREAEARGRPLSKKEVERMERERREEGLAKSLLEDRNRKGVRMMEKMGWKIGEGVGAGAGVDIGAEGISNGNGGTNASSDDKIGAQAIAGKNEKEEEEEEEEETQTLEAPQSRTTPITEPLLLTIKTDRSGIGHLTHSLTNYRTSLKPHNLPASQPPLAPEETASSYRLRLTTHSLDLHQKSQFYSCQKILEQLHSDDQQQPQHLQSISSLKSTPLLYRSLLKHRLQTLQTNTLLHQHQSSSLSPYHSLTGAPKQPPLPSYQGDDPEDAQEQNLAWGSTGVDGDNTFPDDLDESDEELDAFNEKSYAERLDLIVRELREKWNYCYWCKSRYKDKAELEAECPGIQEDLHG